MSSTFGMVGFTYQASAYHPECLPEGVDTTDEEVGVVFEWQEDAYHLTCDCCFQPLLEGDDDDEQEEEDEDASIY